MMVMAGGVGFVIGFFIDVVPPPPGSGASRSSRKAAADWRHFGGHGLAPWRLTLAATRGVVATL
jgi:hypothetical protein